MSRAAALVRSLLILLMLVQSFAVGAMEARAALVAEALPVSMAQADAEPPCHRSAADAQAATDEETPTADCCRHGACRCLGLMLALPQVAMPMLRAEAPVDLVAAAGVSRLPATRLERPLRPPSA
jgi:hypothetical protein